MPHGSALPRPADPFHARYWPATAQRGAILGTVAALHLFTLTLLLRPAPPYRPAAIVLRDGGAAMQLHFLAQLGKRRAVSQRPSSPGPSRPTQAASPARTSPADAPSRPGIPLRAAPSLRQRVHAMTTASRCQYERMKMERSANQFVTRQLVERALDADGCGSPAVHDAIDPSIDAIARRATGGD